MVGLEVRGSKVRKCCLRIESAVVHDGTNNSSQRGLCDEEKRNVAIDRSIQVIPYFPSRESNLKIGGIPGVVGLVGLEFDVFIES